MTILRVWIYHFKNAFLNIINNRLIHAVSIGTISVSLLFFGAFILLWVNLNDWVVQWGQSMTMSVYLREGVEKKAAEKIESALKTLKKGMLKDGKVKIIAAATEERMKELPNVPTFKEAGIDLVISSNRGFAAPKGTPKAIIDKLADAFKKASADPEYIKQMEKMGLPMKYEGPEEFGKLIKREYEVYTEVVKELGLKK